MTGCDFVMTGCDFVMTGCRNFRFIMTGCRNFRSIKDGHFYSYCSKLVNKNVYYTNIIKCRELISRNQWYLLKRNTFFAPKWRNCSNIAFWSCFHIGYFLIKTLSHFCTPELNVVFLLTFLTLYTPISALSVTYRKSNVA